MASGGAAPGAAAIEVDFVVAILTNQSSGSGKAGGGGTAQLTHNGVLLRGEPQEAVAVGVVYQGLVLRRGKGWGHGSSDERM